MEKTRSGFLILTVGWEPSFIIKLLAPIEKATEIKFVHGLVGDSARVERMQARYPDLEWVAISNPNGSELPEPDLRILASIEGWGVPTIRAMIQGDRVLRFRAERESLGYATLLTRNLLDTIERYKPDVVLASFDSIHSGISLGVCKSLNVPWVALAFPVIPDTLTGFCKTLTPDHLVPLVRKVDDQLRDLATSIVASVRARQQKVPAYRAPTSLRQWMRQYAVHANNFLRRRREVVLLGIDDFTYPTALERLKDVMRRSINRFRLPTESMLRSPPSERFVYYPFHMAPESMIDTWAPHYQDQLSFVSQVSLSIPADMTFVIKLHFSDPDSYSRQQLREMLGHPRLKIAHPDAPGAAFIERASLIIGIQGTTCLEAALLGKPVLIFGESPYQHFPYTERADRPDKVASQIRALLNRAPPADAEIVEAFARYMGRYMPGRVNDWARTIESDDMIRYVECFKALKSYVEQPEERAGWYLRPPFTAEDRYATGVRWS